MHCVTVWPLCSTFIFPNICWLFRHLWTVKLRWGGMGGRALSCVWAWSKWLWIRGTDHWLAVGEQKFGTPNDMSVWSDADFVWGALKEPGGLGAMNFKSFPKHAWAHTERHELLCHQSNSPQPPPTTTTTSVNTLARYSCSCASDIKWQGDLVSCRPPER